MAVFADELPLVRDMNLVWVDAVPETTERLLEEVERVQGGAGLRHRHLIVPDEAAGERLAPALASLGWTATRNQLMIHRRAPDRSADLSLACEIGEPAIRAFTEVSLRRHSGRDSEEATLQVAATKQVVAAAGARFFGVAVDGTLASVCDLYSDGPTAQIEAVMTLEEYRNRGLARAVVCRALAEAGAAGSDLVFLQAEEDDWPKDLYARLGFDAAGHTHVFMRALVEGRRAGPGPVSPEITAPPDQASRPPS